MVSDEFVVVTGPPEGTVLIGSYCDLRQANEHALVILSMGIPYWMFPEESLFRLYVDERQEEAVRYQLSKYDHENRFWPPKAVIFPKGEIVPMWSFIPPIFLLIGFYLLQHLGHWGVYERGRMDVVAFIDHGEWWRAVTALLLHADLSHLIGNIGIGCFFAFLVVQLFGVGPGWLAIFLSGIIGNGINAVFHFPMEHYSIGASTALFGSVGLLVGNAIKEGFLGGDRGRIHAVLFPLFIAFVMLGWWGSSGARTDVTAHLFGMLSGIVLGFVFACIPKVFLRQDRGWSITAVVLLISFSWWMSL